jgi:eukaryotic-like serine/threonine-protein kinase
MAAQKFRSIFYTQAAMGLEIGKIVGDYEVIGVLGAGGMGSVYKVRNQISDRVDAMKVLLPDLTESPELADRFLNEIKMLASLHHPNIASLHTALRVENQLLMIMELVEGSTLEERLHNGPVALTAAVSYIVQVLSALSYAHARGVIHRDIKPANIAVTYRGDVKLLDFGIARQADRKVTRTGMVLGSLYYMAPEQITGGNADARSDLYSAGVTLYRTMTGRRPIDGESDFDVMQAQVNQEPVPPRALYPAIPQGLSDIVMRSLAKLPDERFQNADDFRHALVPFLSATNSSSVVAAAPPPPGPLTGPAMGSSTRFSSTVLTTLEKNLAQWLGPIAGAVVRKQSRAAANLAELCRVLSEQIPSELDRRLFLRACRKELGSEETGGGTTGASTPVPARRVEFDPSLLERSRKQLAGYIGPLAKVMVERAAKRAASVEEFMTLLSAEIPSASDREKFLASVRG